jgi:hypothetical protein
MDCTARKDARGRKYGSRWGALLLACAACGPRPKDPGAAALPTTSASPDAPPAFGQGGGGGGRPAEDEPVEVPPAP